MKVQSSRSLAEQKPTKKLLKVDRWRTHAMSSGAAFANPGPTSASDPNTPAALNRRPLCPSAGTPRVKVENLMEPSRAHVATRPEGTALDAQDEPGEDSAV